MECRHMSHFFILEMQRHFANLQVIGAHAAFRDYSGPALCSGQKLPALPGIAVSSTAFQKTNVSSSLTPRIL